MKIFTTYEIREARAYGQTGEIAVHLHAICFPSSPQCFKLAVARGEWIAHLFSKDEEYLVEVARRSGVRWVVVERRGTDGQHVDMCSKPLKHLLMEMGEKDDRIMIKPEDKVGKPRRPKSA